MTAAGSIGQASGDLLRQIGENETDERFQVRYLQPIILERSLSNGLDSNRMYERPSLHGAVKNKIEVDFLGGGAFVNFFFNFQFKKFTSLRIVHLLL